MGGKPRRRPGGWTAKELAKVRTSALLILLRQLLAEANQLAAFPGPGSGVRVPSTVQGRRERLAARLPMVMEEIDRRIPSSYMKEGQ